jgi:hypothetical protein
MRFGVLLQNFPVNRVLSANVTVLIARPDDLAKSCGLIGPSLSSFSSTISVLLVRLMGKLILTTLQRDVLTGQLSSEACQQQLVFHICGNLFIYKICQQRKNVIAQKLPIINK